MAYEQTTANEQAGLAFLPSTFTSLDWTKPFTDASVKMFGSLCKEASSFASRRLQEHADYFKELAECDSPAKILYCNGDFLRKSLVNSIEDAQRAFVALQGSSPALKSN
ncbi:MAG: hypothetical protein AB7U95_13805 [Reyranella sp.]